MKRKTLDKKIIKALAIGMSASMALQPVTAFAEVGEEEGSDNSQDNAVVEEGSQAEVVTAADVQKAATDFSQDVQTAADEVKDVETVLSTDENLDLTYNTQPGQDDTADDVVDADTAKEIADDAEGLSKKVHDVNDDEVRSDDKDNDDRTKVVSDVADVVTDEKLLNNKIDVVDSTAESMKSIADDVDKTSQAIESGYETAKELVEKASSDEGTADDVAAADVAVETLEKAVTDAQTALETAQDDYTKLEGEYAQALKDVEELQAQYDAAIKASSDDVDLEEKKLADALAYAESLKDAAAEAAADVEAKKTAYETACTTANDAAKSMVDAANKDVKDAQAAVDKQESLTKEAQENAAPELFEMAEVQRILAEGDGSVVAVPAETTPDGLPVVETGDAVVSDGTTLLDPVTATENAYNAIKGYADGIDLETLEGNVKSAWAELQDADDDDAKAAAQIKYDQAVAARDAAKAKKAFADDAVYQVGTVKTAAEEFKTANDADGFATEAYDSETTGSFTDAAESGKDAIGNAADAVWLSAYEYLVNHITDAGYTDADTQAASKLKELVEKYKSGEYGVVGSASPVLEVANVKNAVLELKEENDCQFYRDTLKEIEKIEAIAKVYAAAATAETDIANACDSVKTLAAAAKSSFFSAAADAQNAAYSWINGVKDSVKNGTSDDAQQTEEKNKADALYEATKAVAIKTAENEEAKYVQAFINERYAKADTDDAEVAAANSYEALKKAYDDLCAYGKEKEAAVTSLDETVSTLKSEYEAIVALSEKEDTKENLAAKEEAYQKYRDAQKDLEAAKAASAVVESAIKQFSKVKAVADVYNAACSVVTTAQTAFNTLKSTVYGYREDHLKDPDTSDIIGDAADVTWKATYEWLERKAKEADKSADYYSLIFNVKKLADDEIKDVEGKDKTLTAVAATADIKKKIENIEVSDKDAIDLKKTLLERMDGIIAVSDVYSLANVDETDANTALNQKYLTLISDAKNGRNYIGSQFVTTMMNLAFGWVDSTVSYTAKGLEEATTVKKLYENLQAAEDKKKEADENKKLITEEITSKRTDLANAQIAYSNLSAEALEAYNAVDAAKKKCDFLKDRIAKLSAANEANKADYSLMIENLERELASAKQKLSDAEDTYEEVAEALSAAEDVLQNKKAALDKAEKEQLVVEDDNEQPAPTPAPAPSDEGGAPASDDAPAASDASTESSSTVSVTPSPIASSGAAVVTGTNVVTVEGNTNTQAPAVRNANTQAPAANNDQADNNAADGVDANIPDGPVATTDAPAVDANIPDAPSATADAPEVTATITDGPSATAAAPETENKGIPGFLLAILGGVVVAGGVGVEEGVRRGKIKNIFKSGSKVTK